MFHECPYLVVSCRLSWGDAWDLPSETWLLVVKALWGWGLVARPHDRWVTNGLLITNHR